MRIATHPSLRRQRTQAQREYDTESTVKSEQRPIRSTTHACDGMQRSRDIDRSKHGRVLFPHRACAQRAGTWREVLEGRGPGKRSGDTGPSGRTGGASLVEIVAQPLDEAAAPVDELDALKPDRGFLSVERRPDKATPADSTAPHRRGSHPGGPLSAPPAPSATSDTLSHKHRP